MIKNTFILIVLVVFVTSAVWFFLSKTNSPVASIIDLTSPLPSPSASPSSTPAGDQGQPPRDQQSQNPSADQIPMDKISGQDLVVGTGAEAKQGDSVKVNYVGTLLDGTKFDSSYDRNQPFEFTIGAGQVIQGWEVGVSGMKIGGKRKLIIPPQFGYGEQAMGKIPANSVLVFEIELLGVTPGQASAQ